MSSNEEDIRKALNEILVTYGVDIKAEEQTEEEKRVADEDYSDIIGKTQHKMDELNQKAEEIYKKTGMTREQLDNYASNPNNFSKEQWEALQKVKSSCEKYKQEAREQIGVERLEQKTEGKVRKKQLGRFAKKKHWIPL